MDSLKEVQLPSGAVLKVAPAPFAIARDLYQAILREMRGVTFATDGEVGGWIKDLFCASFSSKEIERILQECMKRCLYNDSKFTDQTFEPIEAREDYVKVLAQVTMENVLPFMKSLFAEYSVAIAMTKSIQK